MKKQFEARQSVLKTEIDCTKAVAKENENKATHLDTELRRFTTEGKIFHEPIWNFSFLGTELQRKLDEYKSQNDEAMRLEQEIIAQGKANDQIIAEMADIKQDILNLSRIGTFFL